MLISNLLNFIYSSRTIKRGETAYNFNLYSLKKFLLNSLPDAQIIDVRGFRILSARKTRGWENNFKFYQFNTYIGRKFPSITPEVKVAILKDGTKEDVLKFFSDKTSKNV